MNSKKILITGGSGFVGRHLEKKLKCDGHEVFITDLPIEANQTNINVESNIIPCDLRKIPKGLTSGYDIVVHLASFISIDQSLSGPANFLQNNVDCCLNVLEDIRANNPSCLFILASSDKVYGSPNNKVVNEEQPLAPIDPYGCSKEMCESLVLFYNKLYQISYVIVRSSNIFGPGQRSNLFIPYLCTSVANGVKEIPVGNLTPQKNFIFIEDIISAYSLIINNQDGWNQIYNFQSYNKQVLNIALEIQKNAQTHLSRTISFVQDPSRMRNKSTEPTNFIMDSSMVEKVA